MGERPAARCSRTVCLIGDIHGYPSKLRSLWSNLEARVGEPSFRTALVVFLGDYCDRGPDTRCVLDFLLSLPSRYPSQSHVFLCGNHDLAFAAFVGALPSPPDGSGFAATWDEYASNEDREGWFRGEGYEGMHLQGRRWGGNIRDRWNPKKGLPYKGSIYDAAPTFLSYGVPHGSAELSKAVPEEHSRFLASLAWVHEEDDVFVDTPGGRLCCKMIAVHAGLEKSKDVEEQLRRLRAKDTSISKVEALSGRANVWEIPKQIQMELSGSPTIIASGHHAAVHIDGLRIILDENGGFEDKPIAALVLPSMDMVRSSDDILGQP